MPFSKVFAGNLENSSFDLRGANLNGANLHRADLRAARIIVIRTNLSKADLTETANLTQEQIESADGDEQTKLPGHLKHPAHWSQSSHAQQNGDK
jgi:uncharacterized protein YjbI with pentapeptide repeats